MKPQLSTSDIMIDETYADGGGAIANRELDAIRGSYIIVQTDSFYHPSTVARKTHWDLFQPHGVPVLKLV